MLAETTPVSHPSQHQHHPVQHRYHPTQHPMQPCDNTVDVVSEKNTEPTRTFLLDSGAHPTHMSQPTPSTKLLHTSILTHSTADHQTLRKQREAIQLNMNRNKTIHTHAVASPHLRQNLLSGKDRRTRYGLVPFTKRREYIYETTRKPPVLLARGPWTNYLYTVTINVLNPAEAHKERVFPIPYRARNPKHHVQQTQIV
eukprot:gb/GEZJ01005303.1/.p1 GENE.gb/GEZJ01005303.1/~~gb/GEZJ01005303.1/.p1  ORF type:complete len:199 (+),score=1.83 gb/GEZJ01005303.1/:1269-1865(+)